MCTQSEAMEIFGEVVKQCSEIFGDKLRDAYLYGSYARGDFDNESDLDILFTVDEKEENLGKFRSRVSLVNDRIGLDRDILISPVIVPYDRFWGYSEIMPFYMNVLKDGIRYAEL